MSLPDDLASAYSLERNRENGAPFSRSPGRWLIENRHYMEQVVDVGETPDLVRLQQRTTHILGEPIDVGTVIHTLTVALLGPWF